MVLIKKIIHPINIKNHTIRTIVYSLNAFFIGLTVFVIFVLFALALMTWSWFAWSLIPIIAFSGIFAIAHDVVKDQKKEERFWEIRREHAERNESGS